MGGEWESEEECDQGWTLQLWGEWHNSPMVFQDSWDHEVEFISFSMITQKPIKVIAANGSGPLDDS